MLDTNNKNRKTEIMKRIVLWIPIIGIYFTIKYAVSLNKYESIILPGYHGGTSGAIIIYGFAYLLGLIS